MSNEIERVGVVGLGVMGFDIAFLYAMKGFHTAVFDASQAAMDALDNRREQTIERLNKRNRISESECDNVRRLLVKFSDIEGLASMDLVTEAVSENARTKLSVYRSLKAAGLTGLLTTNTSSVARATLLADGVCDRKNFALSHFFNPVLPTQMVEVVKGEMEKAQGERGMDFLQGIRRQPVEPHGIP